MGLILGGGGREQQKNTVPNLYQPDRHFLALSGTTRNERLRKSN